MEIYPDLAAWALLWFAVACALGAVFTSRSRLAFVSTLVVFGALLAADHFRAGWPVNELPETGAILLAVQPDAIWAVPPEGAMPRSYYLPEDLRESVLRQFNGRTEGPEGEGRGPMRWGYDSEGKGVALLELKQEPIMKESTR